MLLLFPFEVPYYEKVKFPFTFVGHPLIEELPIIKELLEEKSFYSSFRQRHNISPSARIISLLPGSRDQELNYILPIFKETLLLLQQQIPNLHIIIPTIKSLEEKIKTQTKSWKIPISLIQTSDLKEKYSAFLVFFFFGKNSSKD